MSSLFVAWFSSGAASACATALAIRQFPSVCVYRIWMPDEHPDNDRFANDIERWLGVPIYTISSRYPSITAVFEQHRYLVGRTGAPCTLRMKKEVRHYVERYHEHPIRGHIFGFTVEERHRFRRLQELSPETTIVAPLIDAGMTAHDCKAWLQREGIELPYLYHLGFPHNNCIGCVKSGSFAYWHLVRTHFPDIFQQRAVMERQFNHALLRNKDKIPIFLDTLQPGQTYSTVPDEGGCSFLCGDSAES